MALPLYLDGEDNCSCGEPLRTCPYWSQVVGLLDPGTLVGQDRDNSDTSIADNEDLFGALTKVSGTPFVVDSSKGIPRLEWILDEGIDVRIIYLVRDGRAVAYSHLRKERPYFDMLGRWQVKQRKVQALLAKRKLGGQTYFLRYEDLATDPEGTMDRRFAWLDLDPEDLAWPQFECPAIHNLDGNRMRRSESIDVRFDEVFLQRIPYWRWVAASLQSRGALRTFGYPSSRNNYLAGV